MRNDTLDTHEWIAVDVVYEFSFVYSARRRR